MKEGIDNWSILSTVSLGETLTEVMAAKSIDGIGVIAEWRLVLDDWICTGVWHTEMPPEGRTENDDSGCVPEMPPIHLENTAVCSPKVEHNA